MKTKKSSSREFCSVARAIEKFGDGWSLLILRNLGQGMAHFDDFQKNLDISPSILSKRLSSLVTEGLVKKEIYQDNPPRAKYILTPMGLDFLPVLVMMMVWGNKHASPNGVDTELVDKNTHHKVNPILVDEKTNIPIELNKLIFSGGPAASLEKLQWLKTRNMPLLPAEEP